MGIPRSLKHEEIYQLLISDADFMQMVEDLYKELKLNPKKDIGKLPLNRANEFVSNVIETFHLPDVFRIMLAEHIQGRTPKFMSDSLFSERFGDGRSYTMTLHYQPTEKDFDKLKKHIKERTKDFPKYGEVKDLEKKLGIEKMHRDKDWYKDQEDEEPINNKDIAEEYLGNKDQNKKIIDEIKSLRALRKKLFHSSEKS